MQTNEPICNPDQQISGPQPTNVPPQQQTSDVSSYVQESTQEKKTNKWLIIGLAVFVLVILGIAGIFAYQNYQLKKQVEKQSPGPEIAPTEVLQPTPTGTISIPSPTLTTDPAANWETYTSSSGKYSIKYPKEWTLRGDEYYQEDIAMGMNSVAEIKISDANFNNRISMSTKLISTGEDLQKAKGVLELWRDNYQGKLEEITIDGIFGYKLIFTYSDPVSKASRVDIRLEKNGLLYDIELSIDYESPNRNELLEVGNQVLSTFKFTN